MRSRQVIQRSPVAETAERPDSHAANQRRGMAEAFDCDRDQCAIAGIADRDQDIAQEARVADTLDGSAGEQLAKRRLVESSEFSEIRRLKIGACGQPGLPRILSELVPRADREAVVAAINPIADGRAKLRGDRPLMLNRQIRDAAPRIEAIGRGKSLRRTDVEAGAAGSAMIDLGRVRGKSEVGEYRAEKQPGAILP